MISRNFPEIIWLIVGFLVGASLICALTYFNILSLNPKKYVYIDVEKIIKEVNEELNKQKLTDNQITEKLQSSKGAFNSKLKAYTKKHNAIVFSSTKVIAGADNLTNHFVAEVLKELR